MQSVSSRIWTRIVVSNSYDDNHYITGTSTEKDIYAVKQNYQQSNQTEGQTAWISLNVPYYPSQVAVVQGKCSR